MTLAVLGRAVVAFAGCATTWNRADSTQSDLDQDVAACRYASAMLPWSPGGGHRVPGKLCRPRRGLSDGKQPARGSERLAARLGGLDTHDERVS
jgi:hypothetical protein